MSDPSRNDNDAPMRVVGTRSEPLPVAEASGEALMAGAAFSRSVAGLSGLAGFIPKGVYRFRSHEEANRHQDECLARAMANLAMGRRS